MSVEAIDGDTIYITYDLLHATEARIEGKLLIEEFLWVIILQNG